MVVRIFFYILCFDGPDPYELVNAKYKDLGPFWPRRKKSCDRAENGKSEFPGARGPEMKKKKSCHRYPG